MKNIAYLKVGIHSSQIIANYCRFNVQIPVPGSVPFTGGLHGTFSTERLSTTKRSVLLRDNTGNSILQIVQRLLQYKVPKVYTRESRSSIV